MRLKPRIKASEKAMLIGFGIGSLLFLGVLMLGGVSKGNLLSTGLGWFALLFVVGSYIISWRFSLTEDNELLMAEDRQRYNEIIGLDNKTFGQKMFVKNYLKRRENIILEKNQRVGKNYLYDTEGLINSVLISVVPQEYSKSSYKLTKENVIIFEDNLLNSLPALFSFLDNQKEQLQNKKINDICIEVVLFGKQSILDAEMNLSPETVEQAIVKRSQSLHVQYYVFSTVKQIEQFKLSLLKYLRIADKTEVVNKMLSL